MMPPTSRSYVCVYVLRMNELFQKILRNIGSAVVQENRKFSRYNLFRTNGPVCAKTRPSGYQKSNDATHECTLKKKINDQSFLNFYSFGKYYHRICPWKQHSKCKNSKGHTSRDGSQTIGHLNESRRWFQSSKFRQISVRSDCINTAKTPPNFSTMNTKDNATKPSMIMTLLTKIFAHFSFGFSLKHPLTKSSSNTTDVEFNPTDSVLRRKKKD